MGKESLKENTLFFPKNDDILYSFLFSPFQDVLQAMPEVAASLGPPKLEQVLSYFRRHRGREYAAVRGAH